MTFVSILAGFYDPDVVSVWVFTFFQATGPKVHIVVWETDEFWVIFAMFYMKSYGEVGERILAYRFKVILHVYEQRLFISQVIIVL